MSGPALVRHLDESALHERAERSTLREPTIAALAKDHLPSVVEERVVLVWRQLDHDRGMAMVHPFVKDGLANAVVRPYYVEVAEKKHRKTKAERKEDMIKVMVTSEQKRSFMDAAERAGLDLSNWLRSLAIREARGGG